jgi:hypothetical protein
MLKAGHVAGPSRGTVSTARKPAVLASGVSYVDSLQITGELGYRVVGATYSRGK